MNAEGWLGIGIIVLLIVVVLCKLSEYILDTGCGKVTSTALTLAVLGVVLLILLNI